MTRNTGRSLALIGLIIAISLASAWWYRDTLIDLLDGLLDGLLDAGPTAIDKRPPPLVKVVAAERARVEARLGATGTLKATETIELTARTRGRVAAVHFEEGDRVDRHQVLVILERARDRARVEQAAARVTQTARQLERLRQLDADAFVSDTELEKARAAAAEARAELLIASESLADRIIEAPFDGVVGRRLVSPGALLEPGTAVATLSRIAPLDLLLDVPGTEIAGLAKGQPVIATTSAYPRREFQGEISFVAPRIDEATRTLALEASFTNDERRLKPGMFMTAELIVGRRELVRVPEAAVIAQGPAKHLFVVATARGDATAARPSPGANRTEHDAPDASPAAQQRSGAGALVQVRRRVVETGIRRNGWVAITDGISAGERVVVAGLQQLRDGIRVRIDSEGALGETDRPQASTGDES